ncbi:MAG TPA: hypothetical protein VH877_34350 [Polyangia bacterium]|jgi:hypothetical protein|nr:hypothetical protein [Polyangia bacterium]
MKRISRHALPLLVTAAAGCGLFDNSGGNNNSDGGGTAYTSPTLEVTINGIHFGPSAPTSDSSASLINTRDSTGRVTSSVFRMVAASSQSGATCNVSAQRSGNDVAPIGQGGYTFSTQLGTPQYDAVAPIEGEGVTVPQGTFQCTGQACTGTVFAITRMSDTMIEGYVSGTWADSNGSFAAPVVCSFYVPLTSYVP